MIRNALVVAALVLGCGPGWAEAPATYIFDVLRRYEYPKSYNKMFIGEHGLQDWFSTAKAAESSTTLPGLVAKVHGHEEELYVFCKPHDCGGNHFAVIFTEFGSRAVGASSIDEHVRFYGNPDIDERRILTDTLRQNP